MLSRLSTKRAISVASIATHGPRVSPAVRYFHASTIKLNESKSDAGKKRPLSRVAIGSATSNKKYAPSNSIEFASWKAVCMLIVVGGGFTYWFSKEKERLRLQKEVESKRGYGKPLIGGPFNLVDHNNQPFTQENLKNDQKKFSIVYFGFTHCPDICPDELDKLGEMLEELGKSNIELQPVFITCDPARDSPEIIKQYLEDFHPSIIGLTGTYENVKACCKQYRVYFSTPPDVKPGQDYLVDHSIFFYLMDSEGNFVDVIGREATAADGVEKIKKHIDAFIPQAEREARKESWLGFLYK
ncbi:putative cytochrome C oxidase assembly protein [Suhomyces tanzawaensis NRRL Y-17324]|uniref:Putative cytochrome C oxidase assembly protein n=1 Tax=Suhomyces tanzawaensis NRRL Y-17324 TaxID=984487 RepID=A0A1E4SNZ6_9ASCO|nr:putative cytochrome C oxidase assembly protein [Suhomyces tanzawaensis NRRL Y-17324]ODV81112.1 putative cytochrome C oxidase assembly protein [Suhomyces tanzawaensis NRRL Y-17324]